MFLLHVFTDQSSISSNSCVIKVLLLFGRCFLLLIIHKNTMITKMFVNYVLIVLIEDLMSVPILKCNLEKKE